MVYAQGNKKHKLLCSQFTAGFAVMIASLTSGTFSGWTTACLPLLKSSDSPVKMNNDQLSWVMSLSFLANMVISVPIGLLMDQLGHKLILLSISTILPMVSWVLIYSTGDWRVLLLARFLSGLWSGTVNTVAPMYLSEIADPEVRGFMNTMHNVTYRIGNLFAMIVALFLPYQDLPLAFIVIPVFFLVLSLIIPESPHYYISRNNVEGARNSLAWLRNGKTDQEIEEELVDLERSIKSQLQGSNGSILDIISTAGNRRALLIVETLSVLQKLAGISSVISYLSITLPKSKLFEPRVLVLIVEIFRLISGLISSIIIDKIGNRVLLISTSFVCCLTMFITGSWYYVYDRTSPSPSSDTITFWVPFLCISVHSVIYSLGLSPVCSNIKSEFFPLQIKGKCSALTCAVIAFTSFLVSKMYLVIGDRFGLYVNFWIYGTCSLLAMVFANHYLIETRGKSLQEIQDELNRSSGEKCIATLPR